MLPVFLDFSTTRSSRSWQEEHPILLLWIILIGASILFISIMHIIEFFKREFTVTLSDTGDTFKVRRNGHFYPPMREKDGKSFCGWYTDCSGRNIWDGNCKVTHDMTLYPFFVDRFV